MIASSDTRPPSLRWWRNLSLVLFPSHAAFAALTIGLRGEHLLADGLLVLFALIGPRARAFSLMAAPLAFAGVLYDSQGLFLSWRGTIHTGDLYAFERAWFPAPGGVTWPEWWLEHTHAALDLPCGLAYILYLYEAFVVAGALYFVNRPTAHRLAWAFFAVTVLGVATYLLYPAAPPWYVMSYGLGAADGAAAPQAAGAARFDALIGVRYFAGFYQRNANVFAAMPSLHVAYPTLCALAVARHRRWLGGLGAAFVALVAFAAVYLQHHYVADVLLGLVYGVGAWWLVGLPQRRRRSVGPGPHPDGRRAPGAAVSKPSWT